MIIGIIIIIIIGFVFNATAEYKDAFNQAAPSEQGRSWRYRERSRMLGPAPLDLKLFAGSYPVIKKMKGWKWTRAGKRQEIRLLASALHSELSNVSPRMEQLTQTSK